MQDVTGAVARMADGRSAPDELLRMVFDVVATPNERVLKSWKRKLAPPTHQRIALDLLGEIKIRRDERRHGIGEPIKVEGAWFVSEFHKRAGLPFAPKGKGPQP